MSPNSEIAYIDGDSSGGYLIVEVISTEFEEKSESVFPDLMTVSYNGVEYSLRWNPFESCYMGKVERKNVSIL